MKAAPVPAWLNYTRLRSTKSVAALFSLASRIPGEVSGAWRLSLATFPAILPSCPEPLSAKTTRVGKARSAMATQRWCFLCQYEDTMLGVQIAASAEDLKPDCVPADVDVAKGTRLCLRNAITRCSRGTLDVPKRHRKLYYLCWNWAEVSTPQSDWPPFA